MGFQSDLADVILSTIKGCVDCKRYDRILWQLGEPSIECSTLAVALHSFPVAAEVAGCAINEVRMDVIVSQCCFPMGSDNGQAATPKQIRNASKCVIDDVERIMCCLRTLIIDVNGVAKQCNPRMLDPVYSKPSGGCVTARIGVRVTGVPCCDEIIVEGSDEP